MPERAAPQVFRALVDGIGAIVWRARPGAEPGHAHFDFVSEATETLLGYPATSWLEDPRFWLDIVIPEDRDRVVGAILAATKSHGDADFEFRARHADGHMLWLRNIVRFEPQDADGHPMLSGVVVDVSDRRAAEERLAHVHGVTVQLSGLLDEHEVAATVVREGRAAVDAAGVAVCTMRDGRMETAAHEGAPTELEDQVEAALALRVPRWSPGAAVLPLIADERTIGAMLVRLPEGRPWIDADRVVLDVLTGACAQSLLRARSIEAERAARRSAEEANALLDAIIDTAPEGFALFDRDLRFVRVNEALALINGVPAEDHIGKRISDIAPDLPTSGYDDPLRTVLETDEAVVDIEVRGRTPAAPHEDRTWIVSYYPVHGPDGEIEGIGGIVVDITERTRAAERAASLAELGPILEDVVGVEQRLERLTRALVDRLADACTIALEVDGVLDRVAVAARDRASERTLAEAPADEDVEASLGLETSQTFEMVVRGRRIGTLRLCRAGRVPFSEDECALAHEIARRAAIAVDNARLYESERAAREHTSRLQDVTAGLAEALSPDDVGRAILVQAMPALGASRGVVWQLSADGQSLETIAQEGYGSIVGPPTPLDARLPVTDAVRIRDFLWFGSLEEKVAAYPDLEELFRSVGSEAMLAVPLLARGEPVGALGLTFDTARPLPREEKSFIAAIASQCAQALERARLFEAERRVSVTLQRSLLPARLPRIEGLEIAVRYLPAAGLEAGGDFYEAIELADGALGIAVGDVVGRGATAAATMGQLRSALRAFAMDGTGPADVLRKLSAFAEGVDGALAATAAYVVIDPARSELRYACAGHPWPLLARPDGSAEYLQEARTAPLAVNGSHVVEASLPIKPGTTLLLYTDGLTDRRGGDVGQAMDLLRSSMTAIGEPALDQLLDDVITKQSAGGAHDDVALIAVRLTPTKVGQLRFVVPGSPQAISSARSQIRTWLAAQGVAPATATDILLACGEALANAAEHAYKGMSPRDIHTQAFFKNGGDLEIAIRDEGRWSDEPSPADRGRGFMLMRALMEDVEVEQSDVGTIVRMRKRVPELAQATEPAPPAHAGPTLVTVSETPEGAVARVSGDIDSASAETVGEQLRDAVVGGRLIVDLTAAGYLDSAGIRMLVRLAQSAEIAVAAPAASAPRRALELSGLGDTLGLRDQVVM